MRRTVHISNKIDLPEEGKATAGGLDEAIAVAPEGTAVVRIGGSGKIVPDGEYDVSKAVHEHVINGVLYVTIDYSQSMQKGFYAGMANDYLWPLFHDRLDIAEPGFSSDVAQVYRDVNRVVAQVAARYIKPADTVIVHDYHFLPLGTDLRANGVDNPLGFFLHIPVPTRDMVLQLPPHQINAMLTLVDRMRAFDFMGLQSDRDSANLAMLLDEAPHTIPQKPKLAVLPVIGNIMRYVSTAPAMYDDPRTREFRAVHGRSNMVGVARLDYSKNLADTFNAVSLALDHGYIPPEASFLQIAAPSRTEVAAYQNERAKVEEAHERLVAKFGAAAGRLHPEIVHRDIILGLFRYTKAGLIMPRRDGYNLVALEYVAAQDPADPGVLVLSQQAGAAQDLHSSAVIVDATSVRHMARGIGRAYNMPLDERIERHSMAMDIMTSRTNAQWQAALINGTERAAARRRQSLPRLIA